MDLTKGKLEELSMYAYDAAMRDLYTFTGAKPENTHEFRIAMEESVVGVVERFVEKEVFTNTQYNRDSNHRELKDVIAGYLIAKGNLDSKEDKMYNQCIEVVKSLCENNDFKAADLLAGSIPPSKSRMKIIGFIENFKASQRGE